MPERMRKYKISQIPVIDINGFVGSVDESDLFQSYVADKDVADKPIKEVMGKPFPIVNTEQLLKKCLNYSLKK
jgi:cystathionine beta-synthase